MQDLKKAIIEYNNICGEENVIISIDKSLALEKTTFKTNQKISGILYPKNREEVQECIKISNKYNIKLYPISRGKNFGLGGKVPVWNNSFILDLSKMNNILEYDEDLAYIRIESGVTQKQVSDYLLSINSSHILSVTGSVPTSSIVGNVLERGDTSGPYIQRAEYVCDIEVILGNGEILRTGFGRYNNAATANISKYGVGPDYSGIFLQSNFGVITSLTIWLSPRPKHMVKVAIGVNTEKQLINTIDSLRMLKLSGVIDGFGMWNDYKVVSAILNYPFDLIENKDISYNTWFENQKNKFKIYKWNFTITLRAESRGINNAKLDLIKKYLKSRIEAIISTEDFLLSLIKRFRNIIEKFLKIDLSIISKFSSDVKNLGIPNGSNIKSIYWRKKINVLDIHDDLSEELNNPEKNNVGFIWLCPAITLKGKAIADSLIMVENFIKEYDFEPNICILGISERLVTLAILIIYDREILGEDEKAMKCHDMLLEKFISMGYMPNRLGIQSMNSMPKTGTYYEAFIQNMKHILDPNDIISPSRYDFRNNW